MDTSIKQDGVDMLLKFSFAHWAFNWVFQLNPPISNFGIKGIRRSAKEITKWPNLFNDQELRLNLFTIYIFIEIGGTGGGCFRYMYSRFLREAAEITSNKALEEAASMIFESGKHFSELGQLFEDAETAANIEEKIRGAKEKFIRGYLRDSIDTDMPGEVSPLRDPWLRLQST